MWQFWRQPPQDDIGHHITRLYAPSLVALGCAHGGPPQTSTPSELDFRLLCWELHECEEPSNHELPEARDAASVLQSRHDGLAAEHPMRRVPRQALEHVWTEYVIGLVAQAQFRPFAYMPSDVVRPFAIYERFRDLVPSAGRAALVALERRFFGIPWELALRACLATLALADCDPRGLALPGCVGMAQARVRLSSEPLGVTADDLGVFLSRLSTKVSSFPRLAMDIGAVPEHARKHHPAVRRLDTHPVLEIDDVDDGDVTFVVPSPWHLRAASAALVDEFVAFAVEHAQTHPLGRDPWSLRGESFHRHLDAALTERAGVVSIDKLYATRASQASHPDFLWAGDRYGILIEAKIRLSPNTDSWGRDPTSLFETWRRGIEALEQCSSYLQRGTDGHAPDPASREWVAVVVTVQPVAAEATCLRTLVKRWGLLENTGLRAFAVVSAAELEHYALGHTADGYANQLITLWDAVDPYSLERVPEGALIDNEATSRTIVDSWKRLLPGLAPPRAWDDR